MGDGGVIAQIRDSAGDLVAVSNADLQCLVIHSAPLDTGVVAHAASIGRFLRKLGYTYKKSHWSRPNGFELV